MYMNKARKENDEDPDLDFNMDNVPIPKIPRRPHAVSEQYRLEVSLFFHLYVPHVPHLKISWATTTGYLKSPLLELFLSSHRLL